MTPPPSDSTWKRAAAIRGAAVAVLAIAGLVLAFAADGTASDVGYTVFGIAFVLALSLLFLEVGYGEDRARARERRGRGS